MAVSIVCHCCMCITVLPVLCFLSKKYLTQKNVVEKVSSNVSQGKVSYSSFIRVSSGLSTGSRAYR